MLRNMHTHGRELRGWKTRGVSGLRYSMKSIVSIEFKVEHEATVLSQEDQMNEDLLDYEL